MTFQISGITSGLDTSSIINQLMTLQRQSRTKYVDQLNVYKWRQDTLRDLKSDMLSFKTTTVNIQDIFEYTPMSAVSTDDSTVSATSTTSSTPGTYTFTDITQASTETWRSNAEMSQNFGSQTGTKAGLTLAAGTAWAAANFDNTPDGTITITTGGGATMRTFDLSDYTGPSELMDAINAAGMGITFVEAPAGQITLVEPGGVEYALSEDGTYGFFSEAGFTFLDPSDTLEDINAYIDSDFTDGSFEINGQSIDVDIDVDTLNTLISKINSADADVTAYYDAAQERIILSRNTAGDLDITITNDTANAQNALQLVDGTQAGGSNLTFDLNGVSMERTSNIFEINNTTFSILQSTDAGESVTVTVAEDEDAIIEDIQAWIDEYNQITSTVHTQLTQAAVDDPQTDAQKMQGIFRNDSTLRMIYQELYTFTSRSLSGLSGSFDSFADIGITRDSDGVLSISDDTALREAIRDDLESLKEVFTNESGAPADDGFAVQLEAILLSYTTTTSGLMDTRINNESSGQTRAQTLLDRVDERLDLEEARLWDQFTEMEQALSALQSQSNYVSGQISSLNANWNF